MATTFHCCRLSIKERQWGRLIILQLKHKNALPLNINVQFKIMNVGGTTIHVTAPSVLGGPVSTTIRSPHNNNSTEITRTGTMPQRSPFAIQELLGLGDSSTGATSHHHHSSQIHHQHHHQHRSPTAGISAITPNNGSTSNNYGMSTGNSQHQRVLPPTSCFPTSSAADPGSGLHHHHMSMAASRMAYFNAQAAVAAAFLPHNMNSAVSSMAAAAAAAGMSATGAVSAGTPLGLNHRHDTTNTAGETFRFSYYYYIVRVATGRARSNTVLLALGPN
jgi:hypothetical protein